MTPPCKDCKERHRACHSECPKYLAFTEWNTKHREEHYRTINIIERWSAGHLRNMRLWLQGRNDRWRNGK